jgi:hypothetical protein
MMLQLRFDRRTRPRQPLELIECHERGPQPCDPVEQLFPTSGWQPGGLANPRQLLRQRTQLVQLVALLDEEVRAAFLLAKAGQEFRLAKPAPAIEADERGAVVEGAP